LNFEESNIRRVEPNHQSIMNSPKKKDFLKGLTAASATVENLLLTPINEQVRQVLTTTGEAISQTGELILRSSPIKSSPTKRRNRRVEGNAAKEMQDETKQDESFTEQPTSSQSSSSSPQRSAVDICPRFDGTGIELALKGDKVVALKSPQIRGSLLMFDPIAAAKDDESMSIIILQGKNLPFDNTKIRIGILNQEGGAVDQIVGCTPSSEGSKDPIWGSLISKWSFKGNLSTKFLFTLLVEETVGQGNKNEALMMNNPRICAKVSASDLLMKRDPNFWIKLKDHNEISGLTDCGRIQIRLNKPTEAVLHEQENCSNFSPGPAIPRMQSYAIRKMAMYSCSPVTLNVYDVSNNTKIEKINNTMKPFFDGGIFHAGIEIHGKEYSFGGTQNKKSNVSGIFPCQPKQCVMHHYRESVFLGDCELDNEQVQRILKVLRPKWMARSYNVFRKNCAFFSREFAIELGVGDLPEWVYSLATQAESIEPYLRKLDAYLKRRKVTAATTEKQNVANQCPSKKADVEMKVDLETDNHIEAHRIAKNTQEALLDHAMAAKIQRSFRCKSKHVSMHREKTLRKIQEV